MEQKVTCDTILQWMQKQVEEKLPINPELWSDAAEKLNILSSDETDKLFEMQQVVAQLRVNFLGEGKTATAAKMLVETDPRYTEARKQAAKVEQIKEAIRLAKMRARLKSEELRSGV